MLPLWACHKALKLVLGDQYLLEGLRLFKSKSMTHHEKAFYLNLTTLEAHYDYRKTRVLDLQRSAFNDLSAMNIYHHRAYRIIFSVNSCVYLFFVLNDAI